MPAKAGIQCFLAVTVYLKSGFRRGDEILQEPHGPWFFRFLEGDPDEGVDN